MDHQDIIDARSKSLFDGLVRRFNLPLNQKFKASNGEYHFVYATINLINSKFYIGKRTARNPATHVYWGSNKRAGTFVLQDLVEFYGKENFVRVDFNYSNSSELAFRVERSIVTEEMVSCEDCYNLKPGGRGGARGGVLSPVYGTSWYRNPKTNKFVKLRKGDPVPDGYIPGSAATGTISYYDPLTKKCIRLRKNDEIPEGYVLGDPYHVGTKWYWNKETDKLIKLREGDMIPEGFAIGGPRSDTHWHYNSDLNEFKMFRSDEVIDEGFSPCHPTSKSAWYHSPETDEKLRLRDNQKVPFGFVKGRGHFSWSTRAKKS